VTAKDPNMRRDSIRPQSLLQDDGVSALVTTPVPGAATIWLAQSQSQTAAVFSTGTAVARWNYVMPNDYKQFSKGFKAYAYIVDSGSATTVAFKMDIAVQHFGYLTSTAYVCAGPTVNITVQGLSKRWPSRMSRVLLPMPLPLTYTASVEDIKPGDQLNFQLTRVGGVTGNISISHIEIERDFKPQVGD
jgi:hypothetical protein